MKRFSFIAVGLFFAAFMAVAANAQTAAPLSVGLVDWGKFEDPTKGIKKYVAALNALDVEFKPVNDELRTLATKFDALGKEIQGFKDLIDGGKNIPISQADLQKKVDSYGQLDRDIKKKQEDAKAAYQSRANIVIGPIQDDILNALSEYATAKGYAMILDGARLQQGGILLGFNRKADVTDDFIVFYNARPTPATTPVAPK